MRHHQPIELLRHQSAGLHSRCMKPLQSLFSLVSRRARYSRLRCSRVARARLLFPRGFSSKRETARSLTVRQSNSIFTVAALCCELGKMKKTRNRKQNLSLCKHFPALSMGTSCNLSNFSFLGTTNHRAQISMTYENLALTSC